MLSFSLRSGYQMTLEKIIHWFFSRSCRGWCLSVYRKIVYYASIASCIYSYTCLIMWCSRLTIYLSYMIIFEGTIIFTKWALCELNVRNIFRALTRRLLPKAKVESYCTKIYFIYYFLFSLDRICIQSGSRTWRGLLKVSFQKLLEH